MTYDEMKRRVERLEVLRSQTEILRRIEEKPMNYITLRYTDENIHIEPGWISEGSGFPRMDGAIKEVAAKISEEIKAEIAKLEADE